MISSGTPPALPEPGSEEGLRNELACYERWRLALGRVVEDYRVWLEGSGQGNMALSLRIHDLEESIRDDRLTVAFVGEYSRGKTELINALVFGDLSRRLLPSGLGRTTMCPTEIFHDPTDAPCLRLLPIDTRRSDDPIARLRQLPGEWTRMSLDLNDPAAMAQTLQTLTATRQVTSDDAQALGLLEHLDGDSPVADGGQVEVPAWRYALINYPHPLLRSGLRIVDTPGLNAFGLEPELTLNTLPGAHAILFMLGIDTGVTRSDLALWNRYIRQAGLRRLAILNKVDIHWDDLRPPGEVEQEVAHAAEETARTLGIPRTDVIPLSAQKALVARVRHDPGLLERSRIGVLEAVLAEEIIPGRRDLLRRRVLQDVGEMMADSRSQLRARIASTDAAVAECSATMALSGEGTTRIRAEVARREGTYRAALERYRVQRAEFVVSGEALIALLDPARLEAHLRRCHRQMEESWTTRGLSQAMSAVFVYMEREFERIMGAASAVRTSIGYSYALFHQQYGFVVPALPALPLERQRLALQQLVDDAEAFCNDPLNVMTAKRYLTQRFYNGLVAQARSVFVQAHEATVKWLQLLPASLDQQIGEHRQWLEMRLASIAKLDENGGALQDALAQLHQEREDLTRQEVHVSALIQRLEHAPAADYLPAAADAPESADSSP